MTAQELATRLHGTRSGSGWDAKCPAHDDHRASLSIGTGTDGRVLIRCHAGCDLDAICASAGLAPADLFADTTTKATIAETYDYTDEAGRRSNSAEAVWAYDYGKGRVCFMAPGHLISALWNPEYEKMQRNAAKWLLREA